MEVFECCAHFSHGFHWSVLYSTLICRNVDVGIAEQIVPSSLPVGIPGPMMVHSTERGPGLVRDGNTVAVALGIETEDLGEAGEYLYD